MPNEKRHRSLRLVWSIVVAGVCALVVPSSAHATTLDATNELDVTFTTVPNSSDLLWLFDITPLVTTGSPIISVELFNGADSLGVYAESGALYFGNLYIETGFQSPTSPFTGVTPVGPAPTVVDFTSINDGSIAGELVLTVTGGTITFDESDLVLYDAIASSDGYSPQNDVQNIAAVVPTAVPVPEPATLSLTVFGLAGVVSKYRRRRSR